MPNIDLGAMSDDELNAAIAKAQGGRSVSADVAQTIPSSLEKMTVGTLTAPLSAAELAMKAGKYVGGKIQPTGPADAAINQAPTGGQVNIPGAPGTLLKAPPKQEGLGNLNSYKGAQEMLRPYTGELYEPQGMTAKATDQFIQSLPALAFPEAKIAEGAASGASALARALGRGAPAAAAKAPASAGSAFGRKVLTGAGGAVGGAGAEELTNKGGFSNLDPYSQAAGMIAGTFLPALLRKGVTLFPASDAQLAMAKTLKGAGMDVSAGLKTGSPTLQGWEKAWTGKDPSIDPKQFTSYALKGAGVDAKTASSGQDVGPIINQQMGVGTQGELGKRMDALGAKTQSNFFKVDQHGNLITDAAGNEIPEAELEADKARILRDYTASGGKLSTSKGKNPPGPAPIEEAMTEVFGKKANVAGLTGTSYQQKRKDLADRASDLYAQGDQKSGRAITQLAKALDDNMARSSPNGHEWPELFKQYEQGKILQKTPTASSVPGTYDPKAAYSAASGSPNSDLYKVSKAASEIGNVTPKPAGVGQYISPLVGAVTGGLLASHGGEGVLHTLLGNDPNVLGLLGGPAVGALAGRTAGRALGNTMPGQAFLGNQVLRGGSQGGVLGKAADTMRYNPKLDSATAAKLLALDAAQRNTDK